MLILHDVISSRSRITFKQQKNSNEYYEIRDVWMKKKMKNDKLNILEKFLKKKTSFHFI